MGSAVVKEIINEHIRTSGIEEQIRGEGREQGREESIRNTALEMLKDGLSIEKIAMYVQKPLEWVQGLTQ